MYACISETGGGFFEGVQAEESATYFSRPAPTTLVILRLRWPFPPHLRRQNSAYVDVKVPGVGADLVEPLKLDFHL
jgi:hypothetical protein